MSTSYDFPLHGMRLSFLKDFIEEAGGRDKLKDFTTKQVCEQFVKTATIKIQSSYCDLLRSQGHRAYGDKATVFVSHAWLYKFLEVVDALYDHFDEEDKNEIILWIDVFSVNQHDLSSKNFDWWNKTFKSAIDEIGHTVMVLTPWNDPLPLKRGWCILELYCTSVTGTRFDAAMSHREKAVFLNALLEARSTDPFQQMLATIDSEKSECSNKEDREMIFEAARQVGFAEINGMVLSPLRDWVISVVKEEILKSRNNETNKFAVHFFSIILGRLYEQVGQYHLAEQTLIQVWEKFVSVFGGTHDATLGVLNALAEVYIGTEKYFEAEKILDKALAKELEMSPERAVKLKKTLAETYHRQGKKEEALPLAEDCLNQWIKLGLEEDRSFISFKSIYAKILLSFEKFEEAGNLQLECYERSLAMFGENDQSTLVRLNDIALFYFSRRELTKAEPLLIQTRDQYVSRSGEYHFNSLSAKQNVAFLYVTQGRYEEAEPLLCTNLEECLKVLGENHPTILALTNYIVDFYIKQGKYEKAENVYLDFVERRKQSFGLNHIDTIVAMTLLAKFYCNRGSFSKALPLYEECTKQYLAMKDEPETFTPMIIEAMILCHSIEESSIQRLSPNDNSSRLKIPSIIDSMLKEFKSKSQLV